MRRTIVHSALVFASVLLIIALAGCGGGSKKTTATTPPTPTPPVTPDPGTEITLPAGSTLAASTIPAGESREVLTYSKGKSAILSCAAGGDPCAVSVDGSTATVRGGTATLTERTNQMVWQANNGPDGTSEGRHAQGVIKRIEQGVARLTTSDVARLGTSVPTGPAGGIVSALGTAVIMQSTLDPASRTGDPGVLATSPLTTPSVTRTSSSTKFGLTLNLEDFGSFRRPQDASLLGTDPGKLAETTGATESLGTGWTGKALSKSLRGQSLHGVVYSDITAPVGSRPRAVLADRWDSSGATDLDEITASSSTTELRFGITAPSLGAVTVTAASRDWATSLSQNEIYSSVTIRDADDNTRNGHMKCLSSVCQAQEGVLQGEWEIVASPVSGTPDNRYLAFGAWLSLPNSPAGEYELGTFADGVGYTYGESEIDSTRNKPSTTNSAGENFKYEGPATGLYAMGSYGSASGNPLTGETVGSFTATTKLEAQFGVAGATDFVGVSGTVTNFMENGAPLPGEWAVSLQDAGDPASNGLFTGDTAGLVNGRPVSGKWGMQLMISNNGRNGADVPFGYAAGTFSAVTTTTSGERDAAQVVGAFGATLQN